MSVTEKPKYIFINRYRAHIVQKANIDFGTLKIKKRLATRKSYNCNINQPLFCIIRIKTYYFTI